MFQVITASPTHRHLSPLVIQTTPQMTVDVQQMILVVSVLWAITVPKAPLLPDHALEDTIAPSPVSAMVQV